MAHILIATEDATLHQVLASECAGEGHSSTWAADGYEASETALREDIDLALLDMKLAIYTGLELCEMLREDPAIPKSLPIFLVSDDDITPHVLLRARATGVFPKTHGAHDVRELLARHLEHADRIAAEREALRLRP